MPGPEARMRGAVSTALRKRGWLSTPVDNESCEPGTADISYLGDFNNDGYAFKTEGWVELKQLAKWPAKGGIVGVRHFTLKQRAWLKKRWERGGDCALLLRVGDGKDAEWLLFAGNVAAAWVGKVNKIDLYSRAMASHRGPLSGAWLCQALAYLRP